MHHELSYRLEFPGLLLFACLSPAASGGDTALADATAVLEALPADLVQRFEREGWILDRACNEDIVLLLNETYDTALPGVLAGLVDRHRSESLCQWTVSLEAPVNYLMVRSQLACSFQVSGIAGSRREPMGWSRFHGFSMIAKDLIPGMGAKPFVIMKYLPKSHVRKSHPPPQTHFPRVPGAFMADRIIAGLYPWYSVGKGPR